MDTDLKQKWVHALRSGEFKQGTGQLRSDDGEYCCLGVLCVVAELEITPEDFVGEGPAYTALDPIVGPNIRGELMSMNDIHKNTFFQIANYIEREF